MKNKNVPNEAMKVVLDANSSKG